MKIASLFFSDNNLDDCGSTNFDLTKIDLDITMHHQDQIVISPEGPLISGCLFDFLNFQKNQQKIWQISALESKKWSYKQIKSTFL